MLDLFPKLKKRFLIVAAIYVAVMLVLYLVRPTLTPTGFAILALLGSFIIWFIHNYFANNLHTTLLVRLYNLMEVDRFLEEYEPLRRQKILSRDYYMSVRMHLSNAYCAAGRFDDALDVLAEIPQPAGDSETAMLTRFAVTSNLCYAAEQKGDVALAEQHLETLRQLKEGLEALQKKKARKKQLTYSIDMNEQCMRHLKGEKADIGILKALVSGSDRQLTRVTTSLWVARAQIAQGLPREAANVLRQIIKLAPAIYPGKEAVRLLNSLGTLPPEPQKTRENTMPDAQRERDERNSSKKKKKK